jgi:protease I
LSSDDPAVEFAERRTDMTLAGKRIAILAENMYQEMELWVPYYRLREEGAEVKVVGAGGAKSYTPSTAIP